MRHLLTALLLAAAGCSQLGRPGPPETTSPAPPPSDLGALLTTTDSLVRRGEFGEADSLLVRFARRREDARPAVEIPFWRALYKLDPRNTTARPGEAAEMLDAYARSSRTRWYKSEANVLRHLARHVETLREATAPVTVAAGDSTPAGLAARDLEIRNLRAELARVNAELERIKRRLAAPNP